MAGTFQQFATSITKQYQRMASEELFQVDVPDLFERYLAAFPEGTNPIYRERTEHDCQTCKQFIRTLGRVVSLDPNGESTSVWDVCVDEDLPYPYNVVAEELALAVHGAQILSVFRTKEQGYGQEISYEHHVKHEDGRDAEQTLYTWHHLAGTIAARHHSASPATIRGEMAGVYQVLYRALQEFTPDAVQTVLGLIDGNNLYRGEQFRHVVAGFADLQARASQAGHRERFVWANITRPGAHIRNQAIGTLIEDLSKGMELAAAVRSYESKVSGGAYMRSTALITPRMIDNALATLDTLNLRHATQRQYATIRDVSVTNVLWVDNQVQGQMKDPLKDMLMTAASKAPAKTPEAQPIAVAEFFDTVLPKAVHIKVLVEQPHLRKLVALTAPKGEDTGGLFQWGNDFAWSYIGDMADAITERVKAAGGQTNAALRVSLAWYNYDDLDLHSHSPRDEHIYYADRRSILDVDMNAGRGTTRTPVENQAWQANRLENGVYQIKVHQFSKRETTDVGFTLQVATPEGLEQYQYPHAVGDRQYIDCLLLHVQQGKLVKIVVREPKLIPEASTQTTWGLSVGQWADVDTIMLSPNHWDGEAVGNKHWFFFLHGCLNPEPTRGFYNEYLHPALRQHRKVFEVLGGQVTCPASPEQLAGLGFSSTQRAELVCLVEGATARRAYRILF